MTNTKLKTLLVAILVGAATTLMLAGCGGGGGGGSSSSPTAPQAVTGTVVNAIGNQPVSGVVVAVAGTSISATTNSAGYFALYNVPNGPEELTFTYSGTQIGTDSNVSVSGSTDALGNVPVNVSNTPPSPP